MDIKNFYNHIKMYLNEVARLQEYPIPGYQSIKGHSGFAEYFTPDSDHPFYSWNIQIYTSLGHSLLVAMTNDICVKSSMAPQAYKVFSTRSHDILGWNIISRFIHSHAPHLGGMNIDVQSDLSTLLFKNGEQLEDLHGIILRIQQEIMISVEIVYPTRLIFQYMKALSNSDKLRSFIAPKMTDLITFLDNNGKSDVYTGGEIHGIYYYLDIIGDPTKLTTSGQRYRHFIPSSSINNDTAYLHTVIVALCTRQKSICGLCGIIGHKYDACIIRGLKLFTQSLRRNIN